MFGLEGFGMGGFGGGGTWRPTGNISRPRRRTGSKKRKKQEAKLGPYGEQLIRGGMSRANAAQVEAAVNIMSGYRTGVTVRGQRTRSGLRNTEVFARANRPMEVTGVEELVKGSIGIKGRMSRADAAQKALTVNRATAIHRGERAAMDAAQKLQRFPENPISTANRNAIKIAENARKVSGHTTPSPFSGPMSPLHGAGLRAAGGQGSVRTPAKGKSAQQRYTERKNRKSNKRLLESQGRLPQGYVPGSDYFLP